MSVCVVTGYVPLPCEHRSRERYNDLGGKLLDACQRALFYRQPLEDCWLAKQVGNVPPGGKDTVAYHCVQHEKFRWLADAAAATDATTLAWLDYGILHMPGMSTQLVGDFIRRVEAAEPDVVVSPSGGNFWQGDAAPNWLLLGAVFVMPAAMAEVLYALVRQYARPTAWEVNTLARICESHPEMFRLYLADHNASILGNYA